MHVVNGCDKWVWSMAVSIRGGFTGKLNHEVPIPLFCVVFAASFLLPLFFCEKKIFHSCIIESVDSISRDEPDAP